MRIFNIPIFVPHLGCPFDCVFCNQKHITGLQKPVTEKDVKSVIEQQLATLPKEDCYIEAAFFGGSFTGIDADLQERLLGAAYEYVKNGRIDGIRVSTRPDYIDGEILDRLHRYGVRTIELGVQSLDRDVLYAAHRGHTTEDVENAVQCIRKYDFNLGLQMMTGLPGDTKEKSVYTAKSIIALKPDFVRIYPTLVVKDTYLEKMYQKGEYRPQTVDEAVDVCKELMKLFNGADIPIIRIALMTTDEISPNGSVVAGPFHSAFRELVEGEIYFDKIKEYFDKNNIKDCSVQMKVNSREISKAVGNRKKNVLRAYDEYNVLLKIKGDSSIEKGRVVFE